MSSTITNNWCTQPWATYAWCVPTNYDAIHAQVTLVAPGDKAVHCQVRLVNYNITQLRILWEIKTDGVEANNIATSTDASTDKGPLNLKSDIIEKYWQSSGCDEEWVQIDAGDGQTISMDTFALIDTNLTSSAVLILKGWGDGDEADPPPDWDDVDTYATIPMPDDPTERNVVWVSEDLPADRFRWWYLEIQDPTNSDGFVRIGRLVGGSSLIFVGENCLDSISIKRINHKNEQKLNGYTSIAQNRALRKRMVLRFKNLDQISRTNFRLLQRYLQYNRDTLKALVIVDPETETSRYRYTVFSKLADTPDEDHKYISSDTLLSTFDLVYDEGR